MKNFRHLILITAILGLIFAGCAPQEVEEEEPSPTAVDMESLEFVSLFNGTDFTGWAVPDGDNGHWQVIDGVIDYDAESEAEGNKSLWSEQEYTDFVLKVDWRIKETPWSNPRVPLILPNGDHKLNEHGEEIRMIVPDSDSGILYRGPEGQQSNIWCWPIGSGEVYGVRMNKENSQEIRAGVTPKTNADNHIGEWNTHIITVVGDYLTVNLNGKEVIKDAFIPDLPASGPVGLQHHGGKNEEGEWVSPPSLVQFRNVEIAEL